MSLTTFCVEVVKKKLIYDYFIAKKELNSYNK